MHTLHWFAVEAGSKEEAFDLVQARLSTEDGEKFVEWSDWHVVGGGRWSENPNNQYNDSSEDVVSYAEDPEKFNNIIKGIKQNRIREMNRYLEQIKFEKLQSDIVEYISNDCVLPDSIRFTDLNAYHFKHVADMLMDYYTPDSYFYDIVEYTAHMGYIKERLDNPEQSKLQYLVPVDFHF